MVRIKDERIASTARLKRQDHLCFHYFHPGMIQDWMMLIGYDYHNFLGIAHDARTECRDRWSSKSAAGSVLSLTLIRQDTEAKDLAIEFDQIDVRAAARFDTEVQRRKWILRKLQATFRRCTPSILRLVIDTCQSHEESYRFNSDRREARCRGVSVHYPAADSINIAGRN